MSPEIISLMTISRELEGLLELAVPKFSRVLGQVQILTNQ